MKRTVTIVSALALAAAVPAWAAKPPHPTHPTHPTHPSGANSCTPRSHGFRAYGTVTAGSLTAGTGQDRFSGSLTVNVTRANHGAATGSQTYTLTNARVRFGKGVDPTSLSGDRVTVHGTITGLPRKCSSTGFTPTTTVRNATIKVPHKAH